MPTVIARVSEGMKAEIETLVAEAGVWTDQARFIREALDIHIQKYWHGERFCQRPQLEKQPKSKGEK